MGIDATAEKPPLAGQIARPGEISCTLFQDGKTQKCPVSDISTVLDKPGVLVWLDVVDPGPDDLNLLKEQFKLHPLSVEDATSGHEYPKIEAFDTYWFLVLQAATVEHSEVVFHEMSIFAAPTFLVTVRHSPAYPLQEIEQLWIEHSSQLGMGGGFLLYTILDVVVDGYFPVVELYEDKVDDLEEDLFRARKKKVDMLPDIFAMKRGSQKFRHAAFPMRDIINPLIREDLDLFSHDLVPYFRDIYDHAVRVIDELDNMRDLVNSALEIHLSVIANRQNEVMKQLTIIASIFLPLSFVTGFFGQNFVLLLDHIKSPLSFWEFGIALEIAIVIATLVLFKVRNWF
ncbi:MAG: magnesium transporter CorA family protein [Chloroflexota bacterium]